MNKLYAARRRRNLVALTLSLAATIIGLGWLVVILARLLWEWPAPGLVDTRLS